MSDWITLTPRAANAGAAQVGRDPQGGPGDVRIQPDRYAEMDERDIAALLGDAFVVKGGRSTMVRVEGDLGHFAGAGLAGGTLHITGDVGDDAGHAMSGGVLRIDGSAGRRLGGGIPGAARGMTGGEIIVGGSAGDDAGARCRRGLIVVRGNLGANAGRAMIAGTIVVIGQCGDDAGRGNKRGSILACGGITIPLTYRYATTYNPPHVRLTLTYLRQRYGMALDQALIDGSWRRYCGDAGEPGKGEILERIP